MKRKTRVLSLLMCLIMIVSLMPISALAGNIGPFKDVSDQAWYAEAVQYVYDNDLMNGTAGNIFEPERTTTRAMVVTILYRQAGSPDTTSSNAFKDVASGQWFSNPIVWASERGVVTGYSADKFGPNDAITREQMATILFRYAQMIGADVSKRDDLKRFWDASAVSDWAKDAVQWAVSAGLINGITSDTLVSKGNTTRAQAATLLMRFIENIVGNQGNHEGNNPCQIILESDEQYFLVGNAETVTFTAKTENENVGSIELYCDDDVCLGKMHDDGTSGDETKGDGFYTLQLTATASKPGKTVYYACSNDMRSDDLEILFFDTLSEQDFRDVDYTENEIKSIEVNYLDREGYVQPDQAEQVIHDVLEYVKDLYNTGEVVWFEENESCVLAKMKSGITIAYEPKLKGIDLKGNDISVKVITCQPFANDLETTAFDDAAQQISNTFENYVFNSESNLDNSQVTLKAIKSFGKNQVIIWNGHGNYSKSDHSYLATGEEYKWYRDLDITYELDYLQNRVFESAGRICITSKYIKKYCKNMDNSFVWLGACLSGKDSVLADSFLKAGATAVVGFTESVLSVYDRAMTADTIDCMTRINYDTSDYYSLLEALNRAKDINGTDDSVIGGDGAQAKIFGGEKAENFRFADAPATLQNGVYLDQLEITKSDRYTGNMGDSFIDVLGTRNGKKDIHGNLMDHGLEAWIARWNFEEEYSWAWAEYDLSAQYTRLTGKISIVSDCYNNSNFDSTIQIIGDGEILYETNLKPNMDVKSVSVDISGVETLRIYVYDNVAVKGGTSFALWDFAVGD